MAGFSTLGTIDRIVYPNYEPLIALAAAAAVTERIRLTTAILIVPYRQSRDPREADRHDQHLSGGRLVLGRRRRRPRRRLRAVRRADGGPRQALRRDARGDQAALGRRGARPAGGVGPDVSATSAPAHHRRPGGRRLPARRQVRRRLDDGRRPARDVPGAVEKLEAAWREAGREGKPRKLSLTYFALGDDPEGDTVRLDRRLLRLRGRVPGLRGRGTAKGPDEIRERVRRFEEAGCDELILFPASADPAQVDLLASAVL